MTPMATLNPRWRPWLLGGLVTALGLLASLGLLREQLAAARQVEQARFAQAASTMGQALSRRLDLYSEIAVGLRSLFVVNPALSRSAFNAAVSQLALDARYPGIKNIAFTRFVTAADKAAFEARVRADTSLNPRGYPDFKIHPPGERAAYFVADYLWPLAGNPGIHGLDISAQPANLASMHHSQHSGQAVASGPFDLLQETTQRAGFVIRVPVFRVSSHAGAGPHQASDFLGSVTVTLRVYDLMTQLEREGYLQGLQLTMSDRGSSLPGLAGAVNLALFDNAHTSPGGTGLAHRLTLAVYGRQWQLDFRPDRAFLSPSEQRAPWLTGVTGALASLLFGTLAGLLARGRAQALARAASQVVDLQDSEARWQFAIEGAGDGLWDWDLQAQKVFYSTRWKQILGHAEDEVGDTPREWHERVHPDDQPLATAALQAHLKAETPLYLNEHRLRCKNGQWKWVVERGLVRSRDASGRALRMIGTVQDITTRKLTELALAESNSLLRVVIEAIPMRVFWKDQQLNYLGCNSAFARDAGRSSPSEMIGQDDFHMGWAEQASLYRADDRQVMDGGVARLFYDEQQTTPQGQTLWLRTSKIPLKHQDGSIFGVLGLYEDISQRKQAEEQVRKLSQVAEQSTESVLITDLNGTIEYVNAAFERNTGFSRAQAIGQNPRLSRSGQTPKATYTAMWQSLSSGHAWSGELINRRKDGSQYIEWALISPLRDDNGVVTHYVSVQEDVTEKKRLGQELDQHRHRLEQLVAQRTIELTAARQQADASNRAKSEFLANMSHEIRTPMNGVIGMADVLAHTPLNAEQRRLLGAINSSSMALLNILNDILDFSKIEAGKLDIELIATPLREVVEGAALLMLHVANAKDVEIALFIDPALPQWIVCDPTRMRQILLNLLGNALKFIAHRRGVARLQVLPGTRPDGTPCLKLQVSDNGIGMSPDVVARLFEPFTQADASTVRRFGGTGLGLSITQRLVDMLHGSISVQSTLGAGSEFTVELPLVVGRPPAGYLERRLPDLHGVNVLAVSPNPTCMALFQAYLGSVGAQVTVVPDLPGAQAQLAQASHNTVLLLDLTEAFGPEPRHPAWLALAQDTRVVRLVCRRGSGSETRAIEVPARPLLYHDLLQGVALASGRISLTEVALSHSTSAPRTRNAPDVEAAAQTGQLILMAEDNETNRDVMQEQLRLLGWACEVATDGAQALAMWRNGITPDNPSGRYALLLTDCHMPNLDGFELTAAIRQAEPAGSHLPIIAITANAMQGEAQRCHDHGMDDYLCKPLRMQELGDMLNKWLHLPASPAPLPCPPGAEDDPQAVWTPHTLTSLVGNNAAMHQRLLQKFLVHADTQCLQMEHALDAGDLSALTLLAHNLKSAARSVGALALGELCQDLENAGRAQEKATCHALMPELTALLTSTAQQINTHLVAQA